MVSSQASARIWVFYRAAATTCSQQPRIIKTYEAVCARPPTIRHPFPVLALQFRMLVHETSWGVRIQVTWWNYSFQSKLSKYNSRSRLFTNTSVGNVSSAFPCTKRAWSRST